ncbi:MAG: hypothetical protein ABIY55_26175 [Kofleriaceae bacterium]
MCGLTLCAGCLTAPEADPEVTGSTDGELAVASAAASTRTVTIVATKILHQDWGQDAWSAGSVVLPNVQAGDAIVVCGLYWISSGPGAAPSDSRGPLIAAVNQAPLYAHPPVAAQIYYQLHAAVGTHSITPPNLAYGGDGTFYVVQVRGLTGSFVAASHNHADGSALTSISTQLATSPIAGDFVVAVGGEDDEVAFGPNAGMSAPPAGWQSIGVQNNASINVPSAAYSRTVASPGPQPVTWRWNDTTANVTGAAIAAFR